MGRSAGLGRSGWWPVRLILLAAGAAMASWAESAAPESHDTVAVAAAPSPGEARTPTAARVTPVAEEPKPARAPASEEQRRMMLLLLMNSAGRAGPFGGLGH